MADLLLDTPLTPEQVDLCQGGQDLGRNAAGADRGDSRFLQDRGRQARPGSAPVRARRAGRGDRRTAGAARAGQGHRDRVASSTNACRASRRRRRAAAPGAAQPRRQRHQVHRARRRRGHRRAGRARARDSSSQVRDTGIGIEDGGPGAHLPRLRAGRRLARRASSAAPASGSPSPNASSSAWTADRARQRSRASAPPSRVSVPLPPAPAHGQQNSSRPILPAAAVMIVAAAEIEASLLCARARPLGRANLRRRPTRQRGFRLAAGTALGRAAGRFSARRGDDCRAGDVARLDAAAAASC